MLPGDHVANVTLSIVVPTRNRPDHAIACARSILANNGFQEAVFVDQSDGPETAEALATLGDPRVRCVRSALRGATNARNTGIEQTSGLLLAFTDDDCRVSPHWVESILRIFETGASVVFGRVTAPEELLRQGFVAVFEPEIRECVGRLPPSWQWGLTANLAVRRDVVIAVAGFDPMLGPGSPLPAGDDPDFMIRVLRKGYTIINAREIEVEHLGVRSHGADAGKLTRAYAKGTAGTLVKHMRLGDREAGALFFGQVQSVAIGVYRNVRNRHRPLGLGYGLGLLSGACVSFKFAVDHADRLYKAR